MIFLRSTYKCTILLVTATGNKAIVSQATAVRLLPFVVDPEAEITELKGEAELANALPVGDSFQVGNPAECQTSPGEDSLTL